MLDAYIEAELAVLSSKSYTIKGRTLTRENLSEIRSGRKEYEKKLAALTSKKSCGSMRVKRIIPR